MKDRTRWFADCGWGVLCHWLGAPPSSSGGAELGAEEWNRWVDTFDVEGLAEQIDSVKASYFFITIGQNSGHYLAPNKTYDRYVEIDPSKCSRRDLVIDLYQALEPKGIRLLVYLPSNAPIHDPVAAEKLGWNTDDKRKAAFQKKWQDIIREWSLRWGAMVHGWWIDGCYTADEMYRHPDPPNFQTFAEALRAGNPDSIIAFNPGVRTPVICHSEMEDYTAGEIATAFPECPGPWAERNGHRARYHVLSYLGDSWCRGDSPRFPDDLVLGYTRHVMEKGGVVTWDVPIERGGLIPEAFIRQLGVLT